MLRIRNSLFPARSSPRLRVSSTFLLPPQCIAEGQAQSRHCALASKERPSLQVTRSAPAHPSGTLPWLPGWPQKSQKGPLVWQINKRGDPIPLPFPNSPGPCSSHTAREVRLFSEWEFGEAPAQKDRIACCALPGAHTAHSHPCPLPGMPVALEPAHWRSLEDQGEKGRRGGQAQPGARCFFPSEGGPR